MEARGTEGVIGYLTRSGWKRWLRRMAWAGGLSVVVAACVLTMANRAAVAAGRGCLFDGPQQVEAGRVGLVFGCHDRFQDRENLYFRYRIDAAEALWKAGKLRGLIVSGDNHKIDYNEPETMRRALIGRGIPADRIVCDYAGLRTLDSVVRAKEVFGVNEVTLISQRFQNERAAFLARANGMTVGGLNARDVEGRGGLKTKVREAGARVKMWFDVHVLKTRPKHLGEPVSLPDWD